MPLYNYKCPKGHQFEAFNKMADREVSSCPSCNEVASQTVSGTRIATHGFKFGWFEHLTSEPVYVRNKRHMKELCERYDCYAPGVLD